MEEDVAKLEQEIKNLDTQKEEETAKETVDLPTMLTYVKYFMEHLKDLLIDHCNPVKRAQYFGVIFDEVATFQEIKDGTPEIEKIPGVNELFKLINPETVSLVRKAGLGHILLPPNFTIESTPFIGKFVSELPQAVLTRTAAVRI